MKERRAPIIMEEAKLSTQRNVTYILIALLAAVTVVVFLGEDKSERSTQQQAIISLAVFSVGFWLGSSKSSSDKDASMARMAEASAPVAAAAVAAASSANSPITTDTVNVDATTANVTEAQPKPKGKT